MTEQKLNKNQFKIYKYVLFYDFIFLVLGLIISGIIENKGYVLLKKIEVVLVTTFCFSSIIGIGQLIYEIYKNSVKKKNILKVLIVICTIVTILICSLYLFIEYRVVKDYDEYVVINDNGGKEIEVVKHIWLDPDVITHYKYKNIFVREKTAIEEKKTNNINTEPNIDVSELKHGVNTDKEPSDEIKVNTSNLLLKVKYENELVGIEYLGNSIGQKTVVRVVSTQDDCKTWKCKIEKLLINSGAKYTEINGKMYINNLGIISYGGQNSILLVSEDRGVNFNEAKIEVPDDIFVQEIEDVPYLNNGIYEFKTIDYDGNILIFNSQDGIEWKLVR